MKKASIPSTSIGQLFVLLTSISLFACSAEEADLCELLTLEEVQKLNPRTVSGIQEKLYPKTPNPMVNEKEVNYCVWSDAEGKNVLLLAAGHATKNSLLDVNRFIYGETARIEPVSGVGHSAVAVFSLEEGVSKFVKFNTQGKTFSIELYSPFVGDESSQSFSIIEDLASNALYRLQ